MRTTTRGTLPLAAALLSLGLLSCAPKTIPNVTVQTAAARQGTIERRVEFSGVLVGSGAPVRSVHELLSRSIP